MKELFYVTYAQLDNYSDTHLRRYGTKTTFSKCLQYLYEHQEYTMTYPLLYTKSDWDQLDDMQFFKLLKTLPILNPFINNSYSSDVIQAETIMPEHLEVYAIRYVQNIIEHMHIHNYLEVNYVISGSCEMLFEGETHSLKSGELCIIAPMSKHDVIVEDDSEVISILLRENTFETTFFKLMSGSDLLSSFFRTVLYSKDCMANYLLFQTDNSEELKSAIKNIFMEIYLPDAYSNTCVVSRIHLLFSLLLRKYSKTILFYDYQKNINYHVDFPLILQYIQNNYQHITLESLADFYHYSPSYLSKLIKRITGQNLVSILTNLKMTKALDLLENTDLKIEKIANLIGYESTDHFSRLFKRFYGKSPQQFRQNNKIYSSPM